VSNGAPPAKLPNGIKPVLVMVTVCGGLVIPTPTGPKSRNSGFTHLSLNKGTEGPGSPSPCSAITNGPALVDEFEVVVNTPTDVGAKLNVY